MTCPLCGGTTIEERLPGILGKTHKQDRCPRCMWIGPPVFAGSTDADDVGGTDTDEGGPADPA